MTGYRFVAAEWDNYGFSLLSPEEHNAIAKERVLKRLEFIHIQAVDWLSAYRFTLKVSWQEVKSMLDASPTTIHTN